MGCGGRCTGAERAAGRRSCGANAQKPMIATQVQGGRVVAVAPPSHAASVAAYPAIRPPADGVTKVDFDSAAGAAVMVFASLLQI